MIVYGKRMYGKVDKIDKLGYIATQFIHIWFIPLIPLSSMFVTEENDKGVSGVKIPLSGKSVLFGYGRAFGILFGLFLIGLTAYWLWDITDSGIWEMAIDGYRTNTRGYQVPNYKAAGLKTSIFGLPFSVLLSIGSFLAVWYSYRFKVSEKRKAKILAAIGLNDSENSPEQPAENTPEE